MEHVAAVLTMRANHCCHLLNNVGSQRTFPICYNNNEVSAVQLIMHLLFVIIWFVCFLSDLTDDLTFCFHKMTRATFMPVSK